jgi:hypothetical protein
MSVINETVQVLTGSDFSAVFTGPAQRVTVIDQTLPGFPRNIILTNNGIYLSRPGIVAGVAAPSLIAAIIAAYPSLTTAPIFTTQPANLTVVAPAAASFTIVALSEIAISYQWQTFNAGSWVFIIPAGVYSGVNSATLSISNSSGLNGHQYRCQATNSQGTTTSTVATLTVN